MSGDLVIGIDSSTQSTKAIAWSRDGEAVAEGRSPIPMDMPLPGHVEQHPEDWWMSARAALRAVADQIDPARVAGLAISNQRETVAFLDSDGNSVRPAMVWLDQRARGEVEEFSSRIGAERMHRITGKPIDVTPVAYRLAWMRRHAPEDLQRASLITDVHGALARRLTGTAISSWTSADPFGLFDIGTRRWSTRILDELGLVPDQFPALARPGSLIGRISEAASEATGLRSGTPLYAAGGDGQCAGLGVNAARPGVVYLNLGTAIIAGAWSALPNIRTCWRTTTSPTGEGYFLEGCQRAGTLLVDWFISNFAGGCRDAAVFASLEAKAAALPIGSEGVTVCPYLSGCMDPHWDPAARASFSGLGPMHGIGHLYRAVLEALTLETTRTIAAMQAHGLGPRRIVAVGGGAKNDLWTQMVADASGLPLAISGSLEASSLGAGISSAVGCRWYSDFDVAAARMSSEERVRHPDPPVREVWKAVSIRQASAYRPGR